MSGSASTRRATSVWPWCSTSRNTRPGRATLKQVTILETDGDGRGHLVEFRAAAMGQSFTYVLHYDYTSLPESFSWVLDSGEKLRQLDGSYRFEPDGDGTRVHYELAVDLSIPLPGIIKRRAAGMIMGTALKELKRAVESRKT